MEMFALDLHHERSYVDEIEGTMKEESQANWTCGVKLVMDADMVTGRKLNCCLLVNG